MSLTPQEIEKVNGLFAQIDEKDAQLAAKEKLLAEKEILLNKTRVSLNEKQSVLTQKEIQINDLVKENEQIHAQMIGYKDIQNQLSTLNEKFDNLLSKILSDKPATKNTAKKSPKTTSRVTKSK